MIRRLTILASLLLALGCQDSGSSDRAAQQQPLSPKEILRTIEWDELLPEGEIEVLTKIYEDFYADLEQQIMSQPTASLSDWGGITEGSPLDTMPQLGTFNTVDDLDGQMIEIPGFIVPLDTTGTTVSSFLIVPYFGACIHTPPPSPNQIIYATAEPAAMVGQLYYPYWFSGILETGRQDTDLGNAAYTLRLANLRPYE